jgi:NAD(P)-dependent dehydrogenase (short-subunit alcohol dehydrogenase family)
MQSPELEGVDMGTIVITGASSGIGAEAAGALAEQGHTIAVVGRNRERTDAVAARVGGRPFLADYDRFSDVRVLAADLLAAYPRIDVLVNNAGGLVSERGITADGHERTIQHNHLAPFLLTNLLLPRLRESGGRVVSTASAANLAGRLDLDDLEWERRRWFAGWRAYGTSKLATILFTRELAKRSGIGAYSFHPGFVATEFGRGSRMLRLSEAIRPGGFGISATEGAAPLVFLASAETVPARNGAYFDRLAANGRTTKQASDDHLASALWDRSAVEVAL